MTGLWSSKAYKEAKRFGVAHLLDNIGQKMQIKLPKDLSSKFEKSKFLYYCDNETVNGCEYIKPPKSPSLLITDMTSNFLTKKIDFKKYALIYSASQKNVGIVGLTFVLVRKSLLPKSYAGMPSSLNLLAYMDNSLKPKIPVLTLRTTELILEMIKEEGGIEEMDRRCKEKSDLIYQEIDDSIGFYRGYAHPGNRSRTTIVFRIQGGQSMEKKFVREAEKVGLMQLNGHSTLSGIRACLYNSMPVEGARRLAEFMKEFRRRYQKSNL